MFNFFKNIFTRNVSLSRKPKHLSHSRINPKSKISTKKTTPTPKTTEILSDKRAKPVLVKSIPATVLIKFIDDQQQALKAPLLFKGQLGDVLNLHLPNFPDYLVQKIDGLSSKINHPKQTITVTYQRKLGQPILIYCFDYDTNELLNSPQFIVGPLHKSYHIPFPKIADYQIHFSIGNQTGNYNNEPQNLILYYRRNDWKIVQPVNYLVKIKASTQVYQDPISQTTYDFKLPAESVWKVFKEVHTKQTTWLSLGGAEWVKSDYVNRVRNNTKKLN